MPVFTTEQSGPELWVGDAFGPESGLLAIGAVLLGCLLIVSWVRLRYGRVGLLTSIAAPPEGLVATNVETGSGVQAQDVSIK